MTATLHRAVAPVGRTIGESCAGRRHGESRGSGSPAQAIFFVAPVVCSPLVGVRAEATFGGSNVTFFLAMLVGLAGFLLLCFVGEGGGRRGSTAPRWESIACEGLSWGS